MIFELLVNGKTKLIVADSMESVTKSLDQVGIVASPSELQVADIGSREIDCFLPRDVGLLSDWVGDSKRLID